MAMALTFNDVQFDVVDHEGQPWIRGPQIEVALGFNKRGAIQILYSRHADEFTDTMTALIKLPTEGGEQEVRIFSLRGCHLLAMLARTPVAKAFRKWVLDVLDRIAKEESKKDAKKESCESATITPDQQCTLRNIVDAKVFEITGGSGPQRRVFYMQIWNRFKDHFRLAKYDQLPQSRIAEAISYLVRLNVLSKEQKEIAEQPKAICASDTHADK